MNPIKTEDTNVVYGEGQGEYKGLPAYKYPNDQMGRVVSCWQLTPEEIEELKANDGKIYLCLATFNQPLQPVSMSVKREELIIK